MTYQSRLWTYELAALFVVVAAYGAVWIARGPLAPGLDRCKPFFAALWEGLSHLPEAACLFLLRVLRSLVVRTRKQLFSLEKRLCGLPEFISSAALLVSHFPSRIFSSGPLDKPLAFPRWKGALDAFPMRGILIAGGMALLMPAAVFLFKGHLPVPDIHDEFCYLLASDTFSAGRLANPTPPFWKHFESFHVVLRPSYASKFPPAQGLFLAAGQVLTGEPAAGVWLSFALMGAAVYWALLAFVSPAWALSATALCVLQTGVLGQAYPAGTFGYWTQSYFGGAVAAFGGALLFGSLRRLWDKPSLSLSLLLGLGLAVLANSRPYEGLLVSVPAALLLLAWTMGGGRFTLGLKIRRVVLPLLLGMSACLSWMAYYNWRVTGDPVKFPFQHHDEQYAVIRNFGWQPSRPFPEYAHPFLRKFHEEWDDNEYKRDSALNIVRQRIRKWFSYYWNFPMFLALVFLGAVLKSFWMRFLALEIAVVWIGIAATSRRELPHHTAPVLAAVYILAAAVFQRMRGWNWGGFPWGRIAVMSVFATYLAAASVVLSVGKTVYDPHKKDNPKFRQAIVSLLERADGRHLVLVRYKTGIGGNETLFNWVYNGADIDRSRIVWALDLGGEENRELLSYFNTRRVWILNANTAVPFVLPYGSEDKFRRTLSLANQDSDDGLPGVAGA